MASTDQVFTVKNTGGVATGTLSTLISGSTPAQFVIPTGGDTCAGSALGGGKSCTIKVHFSPNLAGPYSAVLTESGSPRGSASATLAGTGGSVCGEFANDANTIALWHFDEATGLTTADSSGNGHTGQLGNSTTASSADPAWTTGRFGAALLYAEANQQYVQAAGTNTFPNNNAMTIEFWEKATSPFGSAIDGDSQPFTAGFCVEASIASNNMELGVSDGSNFILTDIATSVLTNGSWHYLVFSYDGVNEVLYIDGASIGGTSPSPPPTEPTLTGGYQIGGRPFNTFFNGVIDEMRFSNIARTPAQIANYYQSAVSCPGGG
jgi:hypothetical protein